MNNADWLDSLGYVEFLRTVGAQVTVNRMLSFESVKQSCLGREQPLSFLEFNYMLLQAYDFLELYRREKASSSSWAGPTSGVILSAASELPQPRRAGQGDWPHRAVVADRGWQKDGQDGRGRGLALAGQTLALRLLAVLEE